MSHVGKNELNKTGLYTTSCLALVDEEEGLEPSTSRFKVWRYYH